MRAVLLFIFLAALFSLSAITLAMPQLILAAAPNTTNFSENLQLWDTESSVLTLQKFLNTQGFIIAQSGPGSPGSETTVFGTHTYQALMEFQAAHGLPATGYLGPLTRATLMGLAGTATTSASSSAAASLTTATSSPVASTATTSATTTLAAATSSPLIPFYPVPGIVPGNGYTPGFGGGGGAPAPAPTPPPAPAPYVAKAVHFDGMSYLWAAIGSADNILNSPVGALSVWVNVSATMNQPNSNYILNLSPNSIPIGTNPGSNDWSAFYTGGNFSTDVATFFETYAGQAASAGTDDGAIIIGEWKHIFISWNTNFPQNSKIFNILINGVNLVDPANSYDTSGPTSVQWSFYSSVNGQTSGYLGFPSTYADGFNLVPTDFADLQMWIGTYIDPTPTNLAKFISGGKPVNPSVAQAAFGQSQILFSGGTSATGVQKNQGTYGDIFTLTGTLTDASTSPSN
jgi:hypothetical protein